MIVLAVFFIWVSTPKSGAPDGMEICGAFYVEKGENVPELNSVVEVLSARCRGGEGVCP